MPRADALRALPLGQFGRFGLVGLSNTLLGIVADTAFRSAGLPAAAAGALAFAVGAANGYWWNGRWTFRARDRSPVRYALAQVAGSGLTALLVALAAAAALPATAAFVLAIAIVTPTLFLANRRWVFTVVTR